MMDDETLKRQLTLLSNLTCGVIWESSCLDVEPRAWPVMSKLREVCQEVEDVIREIELLAVQRKWDAQADHGLRAKFVDRFGDIK